MKREFVIHRRGKDYVLYAGLLDEAHQQGLKSIKTSLVQTPGPQNGDVAICVAEVVTDRGTFTGIGDAGPHNVNPLMANALIRMAETRAKARALRDAVNVGMASIEELSENAGDMQDQLDTEETPLGIVSLASVRQAGNGHFIAETPATLSFDGSRGQGPGVRSQERGTRGQEPDGDGGNEAALMATSIPPQMPVAVPATPVATPAAVLAAASVTSTPLHLDTPITLALDGSPGLVPASAPASTFAPSPARSSSRTGTRAAATDGTPLPATPTQIETIAKLARSVGRTVATDGLTRAAASELITRLGEERYPRRSTATGSAGSR